MIDILRGLGYEVVGECSEGMINSYRKANGCYPWEGDNGIGFHEEVFFEQLKNQQNAGGGLVFLDRSLIDRLAFLEFDNLSIPEKLLDIAESVRYDRVFFFEGSSQIYQTAEHRPHDAADSARIEKIIKRIYKKLGYEMEIIPFCSREERLKIILEKICL